MKYGKGADSPSCLVMNPRNKEASAGRRVELLAAFDALDEDTRADLLEAVETAALAAPGTALAPEARGIIWQVYAAAGWTQDGKEEAGNA